MTGFWPHLRRAGPLLLAIAILIGVAMAAVDAGEAARILRNADWRWLAVVLLWTAGSYLCLSTAYAFINRIFGIGLPTRALLEIGFLSFALNNLFSFGGLAGYSARVYLMRRRGLRAGDVLGASLIHAYLNHLVMMTLLPAGLLYLLVNHPLGRTRTLELSLATGLAMVLVILVTLLLFRDRARSWTAEQLGRTAKRCLGVDLHAPLRSLDERLSRAVSAIRRRPASLGVPAALVLGDWGLSAAALGACFSALGSPLHPGVLLTGFAIGVIAGVVSMIPGGLGVQEGSMTGTFVLLGVKSETALLAAVLFRLLYYVVPFSLSLIVYARESSSSGNSRKTSRAVS
jgi:glycosyltransferase 2 family protein